VSLETIWPALRLARFILHRGPACVSVRARKQKHRLYRHSWSVRVSEGRISNQDSVKLGTGGMNCALGELSCEGRSDEAGQFVGKGAGRAAAVAQEGAKRRP
jgi:hypothetical protein